MRTIRDIGRSALSIMRQKKKREMLEPSFKLPVFPAESAQGMIKKSLMDDKPCMIARFGSVELQAIVDYLYPPTIVNAIRYVHAEIPSWGYAASTRRTMRMNAGFFPATPKMLDGFGALMLERMNDVDILGSWQANEVYVASYMTNAKLVPLYSLEPYHFEDTWMPALEGKKVLVIHPFEETIRKQHQCYDKLFSNPQMHVTFELQTIKAVQSIAGNKPDEFDDWFEALNWMEEEIKMKDFDIAIIGCGAYGFPLASYVKRMGKKSIHLGGALQYLFGIRSKLVDSHFTNWPNEYWSYPLTKEIPKNFESVEGGRYW